MTDKERIAQLNAALETLLDAMPGATDDEIAASFRDRFPEVYEKNRQAFFDLGLEELIDKRKPACAAKPPLWRPMRMRSKPKQRS